MAGSSFSIIQSSRGKNQLVDDENYLYYHVSQHKEVHSWKCMQFSKENCKARIATKGGQILRRSAHNHPSDISKMEYRMMEKEAKHRAAQNPMLPPRVILGDVCNSLAKEKQALPKSEQALKRMLQRARRDQGKHPPAPRSYHQVMEMLSEQFKIGADGSKFLQYQGPVCELWRQHKLEIFGARDAGLLSDDRCMLLFMSNSGKEILKMSKRWHADGTFATAPVPFINNAAEAWNGAWTSSVQTNASLWTVVEAFEREEAIACGSTTKSEIRKYICR